MADEDNPERMIERGYPDIERPDHSRELRNKFRAYWAKGEQLWDVDLNNNFRFMNWWNALAVDFRRKPYGPYPDRQGGYSAIIDAGEWKDCIGFLGSAEPEFLRPFKGAMVYIVADRMFIGYDGSQWRPVAESPFFWRPSVEVALFATQPHPNAVFISHTFDKPVMFKADGRGCRTRNISSWVQVEVLKNGEPVGTLSTSADGLSRVRFNGDTTFAADDVLALKSPLKLLGTRNVSVSLLGKLL